MSYSPAPSTLATPILGGHYVLPTVNAACNAMVNLFPEIVLEGGKQPAYLSKCPGLSLIMRLGAGPLRGLWKLGEFLYVVSADIVYRLSASDLVDRYLLQENGFEILQEGGGSILIEVTGTVIGEISGVGPVSIADNGVQIFFACNPRGFIYNSSTGVFAEITDVDFPGVLMVGYVGGYFVFIEPDSQRVWVTELLDGTSIDPTEFRSVEASPDQLVGVAIDHGEVWLFGESSIEVYYNSGELDFPLSPIQGAFIEIGAVASFSITKLDNAIFWVGVNKDGYGIVYRSEGYRARRVSNHAIEQAIQSYGDISDIVSYGYQQGGHSFYVVTFPSVSKTWVYDVSTGEWHARASFVDGQLLRHISNCCVFYDNKILVGDYGNGNLYEMSKDFLSDAGGIMKCVRSWRALPTGSNNLKETIHHTLQLDCESGVGLISGQGSDPQVVLRWSDDGGHTWSNEHQTSMGRVGAFGHRAIWRRLGLTEKIRDRVYEISITDPVKVEIMGALLHISGTR